jgi:hypothetical protein
MGWPRKNERLRLYFERKAKTYLLYDPETGEGVGEIMMYNDPEKPSLASTSISTVYLYKKCCRVQWSDMPMVWQDALAKWLTDKPKDYRGFWKI